MEAAPVYLVVFLILYCTLASNLYGQIADQQPNLSGVVVDGETIDPLPYAHVILNGKLGTQPNGDGVFSLSANHRDTIIISHVGYQSQQIIIEITEKGENFSLVIFLAKDMTLLKAIEITPMPTTEAAFKQAVLEMEVEPKLTFNMEEQQGLITFDMILGPKVSYDAYENYRGIGQSKEFNLFSTGPNKGILRAIKSLRSKKKEKRKN